MQVSLPRRWNPLLFILPGSTASSHHASYRRPTRGPGTFPDGWGGIGFSHCDEVVQCLPAATLPHGSSRLASEWLAAGAARHPTLWTWLRDKPRRCAALGSTSPPSAPGSVWQGCKKCARLAIGRGLSEVADIDGEVVQLQEVLARSLLADVSAGAPLTGHRGNT